MPVLANRPRLGGATVIAIAAGLLVASAATLPATARPATTTVGPAVANQDNYSPTSRTLAPVAVHSWSGSVSSPTNVLSGQTTSIAGAGSELVLDFGKEVGGIVTLSFSGSSGAQQLDLAFSESSQNIGQASDQSNPSGPDGELIADVNGAGTYTMPTDRQRGGFRYLTLYLVSGGTIDLDGVSLNFTAAPGVADPAGYANYFYSNDEELNKIWYAGAYTVQLDTIDPAQGRAGSESSSGGWENNGKVGLGTSVDGSSRTSVLVDGAKRDRTIWAGDMGVSLPTEYASTDDVTSGGNSLAALWANQASSGELDYEGPPNNAMGSDTYHLWTMIGTATYYLFSGNLNWVNSIWARYQHAMAFILSRMDTGDGLVRAQEASDWGALRHGTENIEINAMLYHTLSTGAQLAQAVGDSADANTWQAKAQALRAAVNSQLWDGKVGLYRDVPGGGLYPQDGNSLAISYGLTTSKQQDQAITQALTARWNGIGAVSPEYDGLIGTFPGSMEVPARFAAGDDVAALQLIRREWGFQLSSPLGTNSTMWESYNYDGSEYYHSSYTSLAHGWATGPTSALTFDVLGLMPTSTNGGYSFIPHAGDLTHVEGTITMPQGKVSGVWDYAAGQGTFTEQLTSPTGSTGEIGIPTYGAGNVSVTVNGATVWSGGTFHATSGIGGGSSDGDYVYLTGVAPGSYTVVGSGVDAPQAFQTSVLPKQLPPGYTRCATEGGTCTPTGTQVMAYGAGTYEYQAISGPTSCANGTFNGSDPAVNVLKSCYLAPLGGPSGYTQCATEGGTCQVSGTQEVALGLNGAFEFLPAVGSVACTTTAFGADPLANAAKNCYVTTNGAPPGSWTQCAAEKSACAATGSQPIAIGADGAYAQGVSNGSTTCTPSVIGSDPLYGTVKNCYTLAGPPAGFGTKCAAETGTCSFQGTQTVAYGADGDFVYRTLTGGTPCTNAAFGVDPAVNIAKGCYLTP
ncbi:MAG TPA: trehalase family glycosidase [Pseudonocardiaceae bacterium]|jgi:hypothetical protein|nr:trehalase family glycosidase [Pseudonocardiaceae bacterium]